MVTLISSRKVRGNSLGNVSKKIRMSPSKSVPKPAYNFARFRLVDVVEKIVCSSKVFPQVTINHVFHHYFARIVIASSLVSDAPASRVVFRHYQHAGIVMRKVTTPAGRCFYKQNDTTNSRVSSSSSDPTFWSASGAMIPSQPSAHVLMTRLAPIAVDSAMRTSP